MPVTTTSGTWDLSIHFAGKFLIVFNRGGMLCGAQGFLLEFRALVLISSFQLKILTINKRCFGVWPKHGHFNFFKEDYYV